MSKVERYWIDPSRLVQEGWHQDDTCVVKDWAYDRVVAERDALQALLTAADERADVMTTALNSIQFRCQSFVEGDRAMAVESVEAVLGIAEAALKPAEGGGDD